MYLNNKKVVTLVYLTDAGQIVCANNSHNAVVTLAEADGCNEETEKCFIRQTLK